MADPSKSASSLRTKIALLPVHAFELRIVSTAVWTNASAFCLSATSNGSSTVLLYGHGVSG